MASTTWQDGWQRLLCRVDTTGEHVPDGFPHYGDPATGRWTTSSGGDWTGGFWNGLCWLAAHSTGEGRYQCYNQRSHLATQHELIWGSYYLFEALHVLSGALPPARV